MDRYTSEDKTSYSLGMSLTIEALEHKSSFVKEVILSDKANKNRQLDQLLELCNNDHIPYRYDDKLIDKLSVKENCYCIGIFDKFESKLNSDTHIVLFDFDDFGELGTILRSAIAFDFHDIVLISSDIDYFDPRCIRASMGSIFQCNIVRYDSLNRYIIDYDDHHLYPFVSSSEKELSKTKFIEPYSLLISQSYTGLDEMKEDGIFIDHQNEKEIGLSIRSSIILENAYDQKRRR